MKKWMVAVALMGLAGCADQDNDGDPDKSDCADFDKSIHDDAKEVCDGVDNNCNGQVDEGVAITAFWDRDLDGFGDDEFVSRVCKLPPDGSLVGGDCDDLNPLTHPDASEICDGLDNDCNDIIDEDAPLNTFYVDNDGDDHGDSSDSVESCLAPPGYVGSSDDCDDNEPEAWTDRVEICDNIDNDCNGDIDEGLDVIRQWVDADGDGAGDPDTAVYACGPGPGIADNPLDCDDTDPNIGINAEDIQGDGIDQDCDGWIDEYGIPVPYATLGDALAAAPDGAVVQFDAGTFTGIWDLTGRDVTLAGEGCDRTELYGDSLGNVVRMDAGSIVNIRVSGGYATRGGGLLVTGDVKADELCAVNNSVEAKGGGIAVLSGSLDIEDSLIQGNFSADVGGGIHVFEGAQLTLRRSRVVGNNAFNGGGLSNHGGPVDVSNTEFLGNFGDWDSGAILNQYSEALDLLGYPYDPIMTVRYSTFHANEAGFNAQAIYNHGGDLTVEHSAFTGHTDDNPTTAERAAGNPARQSMTILNNVTYRGGGGWDHYDQWWWGAFRGDPWYVEVDPTRPVTEWDAHLTPVSDFIDAGDPLDTDPDGSVADMGAHGGPDACVQVNDPFTDPRWGNCPGPSWDYAWNDDYDGDGMTDAYEYANGLDIWTTDDGDDPDADGLDNGGEFAAWTEADNPDTDGDGVDDGAEVSASADPHIAADQLPLADAGPDLWSQTGLQVDVDGSASWDPNGDAITYSWTLTEIPPGSVAAIADPTAAIASFTPDLMGKYVLTLIASDGVGDHEAIATVRAVEGEIVPDDHATIQEAIDAATNGDGILVRPGQYEERIDTSGKNLTILGLGAPADVILDGDFLDSVVTIAGQEDVTLARMTITNGAAMEGGGLYLNDAGIVELYELVITGNSALIRGGGIYTLDTEVFAHNLEITNNTAVDGGGIFAADEPVTLTHSLLAYNVAQQYGGAIFVEDISSSGAIYHLEHNVYQDNYGLRGAVIGQRDFGNQVFVIQSAIVGNSGESLFYSADARTFIHNNLLLNNQTLEIFDGILDRSRQMPFNNLSYNNAGVDWYNVADPAAVEQFVTDDPLVTYSDNGDATDDVYAAVPGSPMIDAGFPDWLDADGTRSDIGLTGGVGADRTLALWAMDFDLDGMSDGWELANGLDPTSDDSGDDADGDGVLNIDEFTGGTDPNNADTDGDGDTDDVDPNPSDPGDYTPDALAGGPYYIPMSTVVQLDGSASTDPNGDGLNYTWRLIDSPIGSVLNTGDITDANTVNPSFTPDLHGVYAFGLVVDDGALSSTESVALLYSNISLDVPGSYPTIPDTYDDAINGDVVQLTAGAFDLYLDDFPVYVIIAGSGVDQTFLQGTGGYPIIEIKDNSKLGLRDLTMTGANGDDGGALDCRDSEVILERVRFEFNASREGGAALLEDCVATFTDVDAMDNDSKGSGGAFVFRNGSIDWTGGVATRNYAGQYGGAIYYDNTWGSTSNVLFHHNRANSLGGALYQRCGLPFPDCPLVDLDHLTLAGNWGSTAAAYFISGSVRHSIFQENQGRPIYSSYDVVRDHNAYFANQTAGAWPNNPDQWEDPTDLYNDAMFVDFDWLSDGYNQDFHLRADSTLIDAGASPIDPDGSLEDIGAYGGATADATFDYWYGDTDGDGLPDGWEIEMGMVVGIDDASADDDGDGIAAFAEYAQGTDPNNADSDGDGVNDNTEIIALTDPTDPTDNQPTADAGPDEPGTVGLTNTLNGSYLDPNGDPCTYDWRFAAVPGRSGLTDGNLLGADQFDVGFTPDTPGTYELELTVNDGVVDSVPDVVLVVVSGDVMVPEDYPDVVTAIDNVEVGSSVLIGAGTWPLTIDLNGLDISLIGAGQGLTLLDGERMDQLIAADDGETVHLEAMTLMNGIGALGGALEVKDGDLTMVDVTFRDNDGVYGGGFYVDDATCTASGLIVVNNTAAHYGGGAYFERSVIDISQSLFAQNLVSDVHGGAIYTYSVDLTVSNAIFNDNQAIGYSTNGQGGALLLTGTTNDNDNDGQPDLTYATLDFITAVQNYSGSQGAFLQAIHTDVLLSNSIAAHNGHGYAISLNAQLPTYAQEYTLTEDNEDGDFKNFNSNPADEPATGDGFGNIVGGVTGFVALTDDGDWSNDDLHLDVGSVGIDAGDPLLTDDDLSPADMGAYGGPDGNW